MPVLTTIDRPLEIQLDHESDLKDSVEIIEKVEEQRMLVARALEGEQEAFSNIVLQYSSLMQRTAMMIVGDRDVAEDVVQDALIQAWHHLPDLREAASLRPWLMRIVVNQCISFKRRLARTTAFVRQSMSEQETNLVAMVADDHRGRMERNWDLARAIQNLPVKQRVVVVLHYYHGMTLPEMSEALHISENTLKKRIQAALTKLRRAMRAEGAEDEEMRPPAATALVGSLSKRSYEPATV
jgi:RNA polymerase sigma-70 factor (ECF subfamily)